MHKVPQLINGTVMWLVQSKWQEQVDDVGKVAMDPLQGIVGCAGIWVLFCVIIFTPENIPALNCVGILPSQYLFRWTNIFTQYHCSLMLWASSSLIMNSSSWSLISISKTTQWESVNDHFSVSWLFWFLICWFCAFGALKNSELALIKTLSAFKLSFFYK